MKRIKLSKGKYALVDDADYDWLNQWSWHFHDYAIRTEYLGRVNGKKITRNIRMHRLVCNTPDGFYTDHINGDKLDNRRSNLRACNKSENAMNVGIRKDNSSGYRGVYRTHPKANSKPWQAEIKKDGKRIYLGYFDEAIDAAKAYNNAAKNLHGEFARLNEV